MDIRRCELRVASCALRVARCELRVAVLQRETRNAKLDNFVAQGTCPRPGAHLAAPHRLMTDLVRVAAVGDLHCTKTSEGMLQPLFAEMLECADVIALAGDLVDYGLAEEAHVLARELGVALKAKVPVVAVLGNHDYEDGHPEVVKQILSEAGVIILDGDAVEIKGI